MYFPDLFFLMETKQRKEYVTSFQNSLGYNNNFMVKPIGLSGDLAGFLEELLQG